jgi:hypothetical protein
MGWCGGNGGFSGPESDLEKRAGFEALAASYRLMAEQAPHEAGLIIDVELPIEETKPSEK